MASIGDVFLRLLADDKGFAADVTKKAAAAGDQAGKTMGQRMRLGIVGGLAAIGAAGGALFAIGARGAAELTDAMAQFRAETGATQEEVDSARKSVLDLSKRNLQSFDEIARTQAKLRTDLGLTQAQAEEATQAFLDYGTATGRDAAEGVAALDDILDAWNLDASKSEEIMNKLIVSHQKYGGSISESEAALNGLAPALQALNLNVDDGIALLNLFNEAGLDASKTQRAFNTAVKNLPPGTNIKQYIADLAKIEDPGERARKAIEVFGSRAGVGLANALKPGSAGLDQFGISMEEAAGATDEASEAIKNTPFNQLKMALRSIAAPAIEAGQAFGPLILALSQLGGGKVAAAAGAALGGLAGALSTGLVKVAKSPKLATGAKAIGGVIAKAIGPAIAASTALAEGIGSALSKVGVLGPIKNGASALGRALGTTAGKAFGLAFVAAAVAVGIFELLAQNNEIRAGQEKLLADNKEWVKTATREQIEAARASAQAELDKLNEFNPLEFLFGSAARETSRSTLEDVIAEQDAALARLAENGEAGGKEISQATADGIEAGAPDVSEALKGALGVVGKTQDLLNAAHDIGVQVPGAIADGILDAQDDIDTGMAALRRQIEEERTPTAQAAHVIGNLISKEVSNGLRDGRPGVVARAREVRAAGEEELREFIRNGGKIGKDAMDALAAGQKSKDGHIRKQSIRTLAIIDQEQKKLKEQSKKRGAEGTGGLASGIDSKKAQVRTSANGIRNTVRAAFPDKNDGLGWGKGLGTAYGNGIRSTSAWIAQAARNALAAAKAVLATHSPPGPKSPLHLIDVWGENTMLAYAGGLEKGGTEAQRVLQRVLAARHGFTVPVTASGVLGGSASIVGDSTIGTSAPINVATYGLPMRAETPAEVVARIKRASRLGTVGRRPKPGTWERT